MPSSTPLASVAPIKIMAEAEPKMSEILSFTNTRLGEIEVESDAILNFPAGILGFSECRQFALLPHRPGTPFFWLVPISSYFGNLLAPRRLLTSIELCRNVDAG